MKSGSWASYRAATQQERDDDDPGPRNPGDPDDYAAVWYAPVEFRDVDTGLLSTIEAECGRLFPADAHHDAFNAAKRWAVAMGRRHGCAWVREYYRDGESAEVRVWPPREDRKGGGN